MSDRDEIPLSDLEAVIRSHETLNWDSDIPPSDVPPSDFPPSNVPSSNVPPDVPPSSFSHRDDQDPDPDLSTLLSSILSGKSGSIDSSAGHQNVNNALQDQSTWHNQLSQSTHRATTGALPDVSSVLDAGSVQTGIPLDTMTDIDAWVHNVEATEADGTLMPTSSHLTNPWINPQYKALMDYIREVKEKDEDSLAQPLEQIPPGLKPLSWRAFRSKNDICEVSAGRKLGPWKDDERLLVDAYNIFVCEEVIANIINDDGKTKSTFFTRNWLYYCKLCKKVAPSRDKSQCYFSLVSSTAGYRQYVVTCEDCNSSFTNYRPDAMIKKSYEVALSLNMDLFEYLLGDHQHVMDQIERYISNLEEIEADWYEKKGENKIDQTRKQNVLPFMGNRLPTPRPYNKDNNSTKSPDPQQPLMIPMPNGMSMAVAQSRNKSQKRKRNALEGNYSKVIFPERRAWTFYNRLSHLKSIIQSGKMTMLNFKKFLESRDAFILGQILIAEEEQKECKDQLEQSFKTHANLALARLVYDSSLHVEQEVKDYCRTELGLSEVDVAHPLPPLPTNRRLKPVGGLKDLFEAGKMVASPSTQLLFNDSPVGGQSNNSKRTRSPFVIPNHFKPINDDDLEPLRATRTEALFLPATNSSVATTTNSSVATTATNSSVATTTDPLVTTTVTDSLVVTTATDSLVVMNCICSTEPTDAEIIQCSICKKSSHRTCYSISSSQSSKGWCCAHCQPEIYKSLTNGKKNPFKLLEVNLCYCGLKYPAFNRTPGFSVNYSNNKWIRCRNGSCGSPLHLQCTEIHCKEFCPTCMEDMEEDDDK